MILDIKKYRNEPFDKASPDEIIDKTKLDELIEAVREFWSPRRAKSHEEILERTWALCKELKQRNLQELLHSILGGSNGLNQYATNEDIYRVLAVLGWRVSE